jgi:type IX secretion system PorP/SprF family membrane protein
MRFIFILILASAFSGLFAQQTSQFTQFMHVRNLYNPAYSGSQEGGTLAALHRSQWMGLEGAPETQLLTFQTPLLYNRIGIGANLVRYSVGISETWSLDATYAYRIPMGRGTFSIGLQASLRYFGVDYSDERLTATQGLEADGSIPVGIQNRYIPNFGAGIYYQDRKFYIGISAPRIIQNSLELSDVITSSFTEEVRLGYLMTGVKIPLSEQFALNPHLLLKLAEKSPFDAEINLSFLLIDKYSAGIAYRLGSASAPNNHESLDLTLNLAISSKLRVGFAYDIGLSELKDYHNGSLEALLLYNFINPEGDEFVNPRFF